MLIVLFLFGNRKVNKSIYLHIKTPCEVDEEVRRIIQSMFPGFDFADYATAFSDMESLFAGEMSGFKRCDTDFHNWDRTLGSLLATARILHGVHVDRQALSERTIRLTLIAALFQDAGYVRRSEEQCGTGAQFTQAHVKRSIDLLETYVDEHGWPIEDLLDMESMLLCTNPASSPDSVVFTNIEIMLAGHGLATADLIAQMADDIYLEKLPLLFQEYAEGGVTKYTSEYDLFMKTLGFYSFIRSRMENRLSNVLSSMSVHFREQYGVNRDFYSEAVVRNMAYLSLILEKYGVEYAQGLRRRLDREEYPVIVAA